MHDVCTTTVTRAHALRALKPWENVQSWQRARKTSLGNEFDNTPLIQDSFLSKRLLMLATILRDSINARNVFANPTLI